MIQKTYTVHTIDELAGVLSAVGASDEYRRAGGRLLHVLTSTVDTGYTERIQQLVRHVLPQTELVGMTLSNALGDLVFFASEIRCTFFLFERECFTVCGYDCADYDLAEMGRMAYDRVVALGEPRGIEVLLAGMTLPLIDFLCAAHPDGSDIPVFGTRAGGGTDWVYNDKREITVLAFTGDTLYTHGAVVVLYHGADLHIRTAYNFGWHPIGKPMTVTRAERYMVHEIDGEPAAKLYETYLGVTSTQNLTTNICEFPLAVNRGGRDVARIGLQSFADGSIQFSCDMYEGETVRLTYGNTRDILDETLQDSFAAADFDPQAVLLFICGNRIIFMRDDAQKEVHFYRDVHPATLAVHGFSEILLDAGGGGELNSALVSICFREGKPRAGHGLLREAGMLQAVQELAEPDPNARIPLVKRLVAFLEATTEELATMAEAAKEASRAKSQFLSKMSHEIRTPINAVLGLDEMILRESAEPAIRSYASDIQSAGRSLLGIINDVLDFSKIEAGKLEIIPADYDLSDTVSDLVNMISPRAEAKNLAFQVTVDESVPYQLYGDEVRIRQCALNIMTNAVKYTREGSVLVDVRYEPVDAGHILLTVRVADTGIGIRQEDLQRLFSPFERFEEKRNRTIEGTGLGMSITESLLGMMGSRLDVQSEYGVGSTFSFSVLQKVRDWSPMGSFTERHKHRLQTSAYQESFQAPAAHILVVDDTPMNLTVIRGLLKSTRIQVDTAESGAQALEMARATPYHVLFIDHLMPIMDGIQMLHALRADGQSVNQHGICIALTANAIKGAREMYLAEGFEDYLSKPVDGKTLEAALLRYLPPDVIVRPGAPGFVRQAEPASAAAPAGGASDALFARLFGLDISQALKNCGDADVFLDAARNFYDAIPQKAALIEELAALENVRDYTVQVHALKSSARLIGATRLSEDAAYLEQCGDKGDRAEIAAKTPALLEAFRKYSALLAPLFGMAAGGAEPDLPLITPEKIREALGALHEVITAFDFDTADMVMAELEQFRMPDDFAPNYVQLKEKLRGADREALLELLHRLL